MPGTPCVNHADRDAVGNCSRCHRFFCGACLGLDSKMQPICASCEKETGAASLGAQQPALSPLGAPAGVIPPSSVGGASKPGFDVLKHKMEEDDPLGLLNTPAPAAAPKAPIKAEAAASSSEEVLSEEDAMEIDVDVPSAPKPQAPAPAVAAPKISSGSLLDDLLTTPPSAVVPPIKAPAPAAGPVIAPSPSITAPVMPQPMSPAASSLGTVSAPKPQSPVIPASPAAFDAPAGSAPAFPKASPLGTAPVAPSTFAPTTVGIPASPSAGLDDLLKPPQPIAPAAAPSAPASGTAPAGGLDDFLSAPIAKPKLPTVTPVTPAKLNLDIKPAVPMASSAPLPVLDPIKPSMPKLNPSAPVPKAIDIPAAKVSLPDEDLSPKEKGTGLMAALLNSNLTVMKIKIPYYALAAALVVFLGLAGWGIASAGGGPSIKIVDTIAPLQIVQVDASQIADMDITTYSDIQTKLQAMQFTNFIQMTVPELPSPNFFNVQMKPESGTYAEVIKMPGQLKPVLSYVTVFTNGVWYSTNGWDGKNQELEYLVSEFDPNDDPDQLYVAHIQGVDKLKSDKGWDTQTMSEDRYLAAFSDHVRWYLDYKDIAGYQADFADWH